MLAEENRKLEATAIKLGASGQLAKDSRKRMQFENYPGQGSEALTQSGDLQSPNQNQTCAAST